MRKVILVTVAALWAIVVGAGCFGGGNTNSCPSSAPLSCNNGNGGIYCCPYGNGGSTQVCCPNTDSCTTTGTCGSTNQCPPNAPLICNNSYCCPYGANGNRNVCCPGNRCTSNGVC